MGFADQVAAFAEKAKTRLLAAEGLTREMNTFSPPQSDDEAELLRVKAVAWIEADSSLEGDAEGRAKLRELAEEHLGSLKRIARSE